MKHTIKHDERTIYITYIDEIELEDAVYLTEKTIEILENTTSLTKMNFVLDISGAYITNILSLKKAASLMSPQFKKMNKAYIIGSSGIQVTFAKMFIKLIGSFVKTEKIKFFDTLDEANQDIDHSWLHYIIKQQKK